VIGRFVRGELALLYVSPERATLDSFKRLLARAPVALIAIDEAHCVSQWGHDFRPEYMRLAELREVRRLAGVPMIAVTATATPRVTVELVRSLGLRDPALVRGDFRRANLAFSVRHVRTDDERLAATIDALERAGMRGRTGNGRAIIYCSTRKKTEAVAGELRAAGFAAGHYHAGRTALARDRMHDAFSLGRTRVLVATSAFGMGVDYPDVRLTIHFQTPGSIEAYYQEAGRAGRDGLPSACLMLFGPGDLVTQRRLGERDGSLDARLEYALREIERYAQARQCRQQILCGHFTGTDEHAACGTCDACIDPDGLAEPPASEPIEVLGTVEQQVILDALAHVGRAIGKGTLARALRGSRAKDVVARGLVHIPQHGMLAQHSEQSLVATMEQLVRDRRLVRRGKKYPTIALPGPRAPKQVAGARPAKPRKSSPRTPRIANTIRFALDTYRKQKARQLKWKAYMVFQRSVITAIDARRPRSKDELAQIPGLGPAKIARFGDDILAVVRRHADP
jgi:ATP-dependent DNA helicase RecQ